MQATATGIGHVGLDGDHLKTRHKPLCRRAAALYAEADNTRGAVRHIFFHQGVVGVGGKTGEAHPSDLVVGFEEFRNGKAVFVVLSHTHVEALKPQVEQIGTHRGRARAKVTHQLCGGLGNKGPFLAEALGIGDAVIAVVGGAKTGEFLLLCHPVKATAVHDTTAHGRAVSVHILGGGMGHDVRAELEGTAEHRGGKGVINDKRNAVGVRRLGEKLDVQHVERGVCHRLAEHRLGVGTEGRL